VGRDGKRVLKFMKCRRTTEDIDAWRRRIEEAKKKKKIQTYKQLNI
jgi:hypothetical protein